MNDIVNRLLDDALKTKDPERLRKIASELQRYGAWDDADLVRNKAHDIERHMAELAAK